MVFKPIPGNPSWEYDDNPPDPGGTNTALWSTGTNGIRTSVSDQEIYQNARLIGSNAPSRPSEISKTFWDYRYNNLLAELYGGGAVAYSLRALNGNGDNVVRVRRASDNSEQDFTASQVSAGALTSFVNESGFMRFNLVENAINGSFADGPTNQTYTSNAENTVWTGQTTSSHTFQYTGSAWFYRYTDSATGNIYQVTANADSTDPFNANWFSSTVTTSTYNHGSYYGQSVNFFSATGYFSFFPPSLGLVATWYDQSGNGRDATQSVAGNQPKIVVGGTLVTKLGQPSIDFTTGSAFLVSDSFSITETESAVFAIWQPAKDSATAVEARNRTLFGNISSQIYIGTPNSDSQMSFKRFDAIQSFTLGLANLKTPNLHALVGTTAGADYYFNGSSIYSNTATGTNSTRNDLHIGTKQNLFGHDTEGYISELIIYNSDQSANRTAIEANINAHYNIY